MTEFVKWEDTKARRRAADTRSEAQRAAAKKVARARLDAYVLGHQLAELRKERRLTQRELASRLGVSQARVSQIESGEVSGFEVVRDYVAAVGGRFEMTATFEDGSRKLA